MARSILLLLLVSLVAACALALPGAGDKPPAGISPLATESISVTALPAPEWGQTPVNADAAAVVVPADVAKPKPRPQPDAPEAAITVKPAPALPAAPPLAALRTPAQIACEKQGGRLVVAGKTGATTCQRTTRDAGKQCRRQDDCEGFCLARSNSCAPVTPLFGCNDILQADGRRVTLCLD